MNQSFFSKRIGRLEFFVFLAVPYVLMTLVSSLAPYLNGMSQVQIFITLLKIFNYVWFFWFIILSIKRIHDMNLNTWYVLLPTIFILLFGVLTFGIGTPIAVFLSVAIFSLKKGTVGPNNFGEDPVAARV